MADDFAAAAGDAGIATDLYFATLAEREIAYDARNSVADFTAEIRAYSEMSQRARALQPPTVDLRYGMGADERLDYFAAKSSAVLPPLFVYIHGGYWRSQRKEDACLMADAFVRAGISLATVEYTLTPHCTLPEIVREVRSAIAWLWREADALAFDRDRIHVAGSSAGGHLAAMLLGADWQPLYEMPAQVLKSVVSLSGLYDVRPLCDIALNEVVRLPAEQAPLVSPLTRRPAGHEKVLLTVGELEPAGFHAQQWAFVAWLEACGITPLVLPSPGRNHFDLLHLLADPGSALFRAVRDLCIPNSSKF